MLSHEPGEPALLGKHTPSPAAPADHDRDDPDSAEREVGGLSIDEGDQLQVAALLGELRNEVPRVDLTAARLARDEVEQVEADAAQLAHRGDLPAAAARIASSACSGPKRRRSHSTGAGSSGSSPSRASSSAAPSKGRTGSPS